MTSTEPSFLGQVWCPANPICQFQKRPPTHIAHLIFWKTLDAHWSFPLIVLSILLALLWPIYRFQHIRSLMMYYFNWFNMKHSICLANKNLNGPAQLIVQVLEDALTIMRSYWGSQIAVLLPRSHLPLDYNCRIKFLSWMRLVSD